LGETEDDGPPPRKRRHVESDGGDDEEEFEGRQSKNKKRSTGVVEASDPEEGSDSEGNTWMLGHVDEEDDTEVDSDEAFGESDEERFEGWTFRGSASNTSKGKSVNRKRDKVDPEGAVDNDEISLDEDNDDSEDGEEDDGLGDDAIDLAAALDQYSAGEEDNSDEGSLRQRTGK
jgi:U3 small nucleolar RNA-associated protein 14